MPDREKVVKARKCCSEGNCLSCPFVKDHMEPHVIGCMHRLMKYALELLKKQAEGEMLAGIVADIKAGRVRRFAGDGFEVVRCET